MATARPRRRGKAKKATREAAASKHADEEPPSPKGKPSSPFWSGFEVGKSVGNEINITSSLLVLSFMAVVISVAAYYVFRGAAYVVRGGGGSSPIGAGNTAPPPSPLPGIHPPAPGVGPDERGIAAGQPREENMRQAPRQAPEERSGCHPHRQHLCSAEEIRRATAAAGPFERGNQFKQARRFEEAREAYEASISIDSTSAFAASAYQNLGRVLGELGREAASREALRTAVRLDGESVYAHMGLAVSLSNTHRPADWHEGDRHCAIALDLLSEGGVAEGQKDNLFGIIAANHGIVLKRIAKRDPGLTPGEQKIFLDKATGQFEKTVDLARDGKVPPPLAINAVTHLQDLLRSDDGGPSPRRDRLLDWAVDAAGLWGDRRQLPLQFNRALYDAVEKPLRPWIRDPTRRFPALRQAQEEWQRILAEYRAAAGARGVRPVGERVDFDRELYDRRAGEDWSEIPILTGDGVKQSPGIAPLVASMFRGLIPPAGAAAFSSITSGTSIKPHCGPTNEMVTCHLGLIVPEHESIDELGIVAGGERRRWTEGEWMCFEDSMEHAVWNRSGGTRVVLIVQLKHYLLG